MKPNKPQTTPAPTTLPPTSRVPAPSDTGLRCWGTMIAILYEGFVYVGDVYQDGDFYLIVRGA